MTITLLFPAYNEEKNVENTIKQIYEFSKKYSFELVFSLDGCTDNTLEKLKLELKKYNLSAKILVRKKNMGKGKTVKEGIMKVNTDLVLISDFDLSTPLEELEKLLKYIDEYDIVIGSRWINTDEIKNTPKRKIMSFLSILLINLLLNLKVKDSQCGFKLFKTKIAKEIFKLSKINRFGYDFEILLIAKLNKIKYKEVPVSWSFNSNSKVKLESYFVTLKELISVYLDLIFNRKRYYISKKN
ncbi:MAG: glycosyltransferase [Candidatus Woesearchaeota archaeon]